jgi:hypothetical protein
MPIIMFDKDSNFIVMKLEEVSLNFPCHEYVYRFSLTPLASSPIIWSR